MAVAGDGRAVGPPDRTLRQAGGHTAACVQRPRIPEHPQALPRSGQAGWARRLVLNRRGADARRDRLLENYPIRPGFDRDEYPPAVGRGRGRGLERGARDGLHTKPLRRPLQAKRDPRLREGTAPADPSRVRIAPTNRPHPQRPAGPRRPAREAGTQRQHSPMLAAPAPRDLPARDTAATPPSTRAPGSTCGRAKPP